MRIATGLLITLLFFFSFAYIFVLVTEEAAYVQSIDEVLDENIQIDTISLSTNSYIVDRNQEVISEVYSENRIYLPYDEIPPLVIEAFLATEDRRFFEHKGYDPSAIARAFMVNMQSNSIEQGASTVTQQLVRNLYLGHNQTYDRKISELLYAFKLEETFTKEQIIELYINTIFFQNNIYGFEAASRFYFSKPSSELTLAEIAFLSAVPNNPSHYNPLTNFDNTVLRQEWILQKMLEVNVISEEEFDEAVNEKITLNQSKRIDQYPDYVTYIHHEFKQLIAKNEGYTQRMKSASDEEKAAIELQLQERINTLFEQGIIIETALDPLLQKKAVDAFNRHLPNSIQGAATVIHHPTHEVVAITGGKGFEKFGFHRGYQSYRQPGSAIKPLLIYAPYLNEYEVPLQSKINANNYCKNNYCPQNYGGGEYGDVSISTALMHSYNTPAVRILDRVGIETAFSYLEPFQFEKVIEKDKGLPSALGGFSHGMSTYELTNAYTTFANDGEFEKAYGIRQVTDLNGNSLYEWPSSSTRVWSSQTNDKMKTLLNRVVTEGTGKQAHLSSSYIGGKTGTTNGYHDFWFVGIRNEYTTGVWVGKDKQESMANVRQSKPHLSIWRDIMK
ncbi:transglycosylase domain-containing protein [Alkalihalobacterium bogoriense]|uniref:transglycosylase domain-containing protein n=1 Tax=Alkalihalobacterium bogoriense TaxID=246272 RepID=UPI00047E0C09|nr:transglycosylase domain-containing protein [Alkalihalobacterium bogoriense]